MIICARRSLRAVPTATQCELAHIPPGTINNINLYVYNSSHVATHKSFTIYMFATTSQHTTESADYKDLKTCDMFDF